MDAKVVRVNKDTKINVGKFTNGDVYADFADTYSGVTMVVFNDVDDIDRVIDKLNFLKRNLCMELRVRNDK